MEPRLYICVDFCQQRLQTCVKSAAFLKTIYVWLGELILDSHPVRPWNKLSSTHNRFTVLFLGPPRWAIARTELLDFMVQGMINRGRHTDHLAGRHSIRTNQCPTPPSPIFFLQAGCPSCRPTNSGIALKATSTFGLGRSARVLPNGVTCTVSVPYKLQDYSMGVSSKA